MIPNGTRVLIDMANKEGKAVIALLNVIGGEVVKEFDDIGYNKIGYLVAYDVEHLAAIEQAREIDEQNGLGTIFFSILGKMRAKEFPGDERYYLLAFESELKPD